MAGQASPVTLGSPITYGYDDASRLKSVSDGVYSVGYTYEPKANLVRTVTLKQNTTLRLSTEQRYDLLGRLRSISTALNGSSGLPAVASAYQYTSANQRSRNREADGSYWDYRYDALGQVTSGKKYWADGTPVAGMQYEYSFDDIGNRKTAKWGGDQTGSALRSATYIVNRLNQYTQRTVPGSFDVIGMVSSGSQSVTVNGTTPYRKDGFFRQSVTAANSTAPQWVGVTVSAPGSGAANQTGNVWVPKTAEVYVPDEDGNLLTDGRWNYVWDGENRLTQMTARTAVGPQLRLEFEYDWMGRRIGKKVWTNVNGTGQPTVSRVYVYRGWNLVMEWDAATPSAVTQYVWGRDLAGGVDGAGLPGQSQGSAGGVGGLVGIRTGTTTYGVAYDGNGNVMGLVDGSTGTVAARYEYGPFGEVVRATGPMSKINPFRFSTKYQDEETDLVYYGFRFYNASTGRWPNRDPIGERGGRNLYAFLSGNPLNQIDPYGEDARTYGPITIFIPFTTDYFWESEAERAHEAQHRADWLTGIPGWQKEQRGFGAEIPVLKEQINAIQAHINFLNARRCKLKGTDQALAALAQSLLAAQAALAQAEELSQSDYAAITYWNLVNPQYPVPLPIPPQPIPPRIPKSP